MEIVHSFKRFSNPRSASAAVCFFFVLQLGSVAGQVRGVYPLGMSATGSGVTPGPGFSYVNQLLIYSRDRQVDANGDVIATGSNSVIMDMNTIAWVSKRKILHGARLSASATIPFANNALESDVKGHISGGGGVADSFYQPFILGWQTERVAVKTAYGFLAPTGRHDFTKNDNVGSGYWTHVVSSGQTIYLTESKRTSISAFQMYEWHTTQEDTGIHPGQNLDLDYSVMQSLGSKRGIGLQVGMVGYGQWQTTAKTGPAVTPAQQTERYKVNAIGVASNFNVPAWRLNLGFKYFKEFACRSTFQGYSIQFTGAYKF